MDWRCGTITLPQHAVEFQAQGAQAPPTRGHCAFVISGDAVASMLRCPKTRGSVKLWHVSGKPRASSGTESPNVVPSAQGYRVRDRVVYEMFNNVIRDCGYSIDACIESAIVALNADRKLATM